jgi:hypothetical protein
MSNTSIPSLGQLQRALKISEQIQELKAQLAGVLGNAVAQDGAGAAAPKAKRKYTKKSAAPGGAAPAKTKRTMSPEAREKIAAAQRARWAKQLKKSKKKS